MHSELPTRFTPECSELASSPETRGMLVRIHPVCALEQPIELSARPQGIGRESQCPICLPDDTVSRKHAEITFDRGQYYVRDLGSRNGTYINEQRITGCQALAAGDRVRFGNQIFKYLSADGIESQYHEVMFKLMTTDGLTLAYNKRYFQETLDRELEQTKRGGAALAIMIMDLDKFKSINDTYGHLAGDAVLVEFARRAQSQLRRGELFARYGGEEFVLLAPRTSVIDARTVAERIRSVTAEKPFEFEGQCLPVTVSIGLYGFQGEQAGSARELLSAADQLLYVAKKSGRNQVQSSEGTAV